MDESNEVGTIPSAVTLSDNQVGRGIAGFIVAFAAVCAAYVWDVGLNWRVLGIALVALAVGVAARYATMTLELDKDGIFIRQLPLRRRVLWSELAEVLPTPGSNITGMTYCVGLRLIDGTLLRAYAVQGYGQRNARVCNAVVTIQARWQAWTSST